MRSPPRKAEWRDVEQRQPLARADRPGRRARVARERCPHALGLAEHERRVEPLAAELRVEREQRLGVVAPSVGRLPHELPRAVLARDRLRLRPVHEPRPARLAELARDGELRVGELERLAARPRVLHTSLRLAPRALEIDPSCLHRRSPPCRPRSATAGGGRSEHVALRWDRGGPGALPADQGAPSRAPRTLPRRPRARKPRRGTRAQAVLVDGGEPLALHRVERDVRAPAGAGLDAAPERLPAHGALDRPHVATVLAAGPRAADDQRMRRSAGPCRRLSATRRPLLRPTLRCSGRPSGKVFTGLTGSNSVDQFSDEVGREARGVRLLHLLERVQRVHVQQRRAGRRAADAPHLDGGRNYGISRGDLAARDRPRRGRRTTCSASMSASPRRVCRSTCG